MLGFMRYFLICFLLPLISFAQPRDNRELPIFEPVPYYHAGDSLVGWSLSSDGQWISSPNTIPVIGISRNEKFYERDENSIGIDNIQKLIAYKVKYGTDTLICLVKVYTDGQYRYPNRKKGWKNFTAGYYWIVRYRDLRNALDYYEENDTASEAFVLRIKSLEGKAIREIEDLEDEDDMRELLKQIQATTIIKPNYDRNLVLTIQKGSNKDFIRLHLCSLHVIFSDVEGVRKNYTKRGRSVYGSVRLFDYMYFEMNRKEFYNILDLDANLDQLLEEEMMPVFDSGSRSTSDPLLDSSEARMDSLDID